MINFRYRAAMFVCAFISAYAFANIDIYEFSSEEHRQSYLALTKELRCPKCQNQDIADSNAPIASDMRREVYRLVEEGQSHEHVVSFMIERFGDFVTYKPKKTSETFILWYGPWIFIGLGLIFIIFTIKRRNRKKLTITTVDSQPNSDPQHEQVKQLLKDYGDPTINKVNSND